MESLDHIGNKLMRTDVTKEEESLLRLLKFNKPPSAARRSQRKLECNGGRLEGWSEPGNEVARADKVASEGDGEQRRCVSKRPVCAGVISHQLCFGDMGRENLKCLLSL